LLTVRDEDLIYQVHRTIQRIEQVLKRHDRKSVRLGGEAKKPKAHETHTGQQHEIT
jgi:hypothetical protein